MELIQAILLSFAALFPVVNPIGSSIIFLALVPDASEQEIQKLALKISIYVIVMLILVLFIGSIFFQMFGVTTPIVLIGGGCLLVHVGWSMLNHPEDSKLMDMSINQMEKVTYHHKAFYPLTVPVTASPSCLAITIALGAHLPEKDWELIIVSKIGYSIGIILTGMSVYFCYRYSSAILNKLKSTGKNVLMCLASFMNLCIGLEVIWHGVTKLIQA